MQHNWSNIFESVAEANQKAVAVAAELNKIATRTQGELVRKQISILESCLDAGTKHLKVVAETRDPQEFVKRETELAVEFGEKLVANAQESLEIQVQAREEMSRWFEEGLKDVRAKAEAVVKPQAPARKSTRTENKAA